MSKITRRWYIPLVVAGYFVFALAWIFLSDRLLSLFTDLRDIVWLSTAKGAFFVVTTTALLYLVLRKFPVPDSQNNAHSPHEYWVGDAMEFSAAHSRGTRWFAYLFALLLPLTALVMQLAIATPDHLMLILLMLPIILSALLGGLGPGLVATAVAALGADYWIIQPVHSLLIAGQNDLLQWSFLIINGVSVSVLSESLQSSRRQAQMHQRQLQAIVTGTSDAVFVKDLQGRYLMINEAGAQFVGMPIEQIVGRDDSALFAQETAGPLMEADRAIMRRAATQSHEERITRHDGSKLVFSVTKGPVFGLSGVPSGMFGISRDITQRIASEAALRESEDRYRSAFRSSPDAITISRLSDGRYLDVNEGFERIFGWPAAQALGKTSHDLAIWRHLSDREAFMDTNVRQGLCENQELQFCTRDGRVITALVSSHVMQLGGDDCILAVTRDITARKEAEEALHMAALVYQSSSEAMMVTDAQSNIVAVNPAFEKITGYTSAEVLGKNPRVLNSHRHEPAFYQAMWAQLNTTGRWEGDIWNRKKNGELFFEHISINSIFLPDGALHRRVALFSDITQKKETEEFIWRQANFDALTQLPNRRMFHDRVDQEIKKAHRENQHLALFFIDLDNFKEVNDTLGHHMGDVLLVEAARRISSAVRETDSVARMGGDEFTVLLPSVAGAEDVDRVAVNILGALSLPYVLGTETVVVSASIGVAMHPSNGETFDELLKNADQALYLAKRQGRNRYSYFTQDLQDAAIRRLRLVRDLRNAVSEQQLRVYFQPIVELATGAIFKGEALVRWQHPQHGMIGPAEFIPVAEDTGLIVEIGEWVFREAARWAKQWRQRYSPAFQVSVNKSPVQFQRTALLTGWVDYLQEIDLPGNAIAVEITEGVLMSSDLSVDLKLAQYRESGMQVAIDDFGTGYSSLAYLKKFHIDYLKIDQSFTRNLAPGSSDLALSEAIIVMAHKLGLRVIAEGVETQEQMDLLRSVGCDFGQGYLFSRPVAAQEFELLLQKQLPKNETGA